ncbi:MAG TPA: carbamoyltransferase HypF, partial [Rhodobacteraceae bacterium]|nr:carbamoyltransferase HypF [Paracoccaceae bacterium]
MTAGRDAGGWQIRVRGLVQGVGFRPCVWNLAQAARLEGEVLNDGEGVLVHLASTREEADALASAIRTDAPPLARIDAIEITPCTPPAGTGFRIVASRTGTSRAAVTPDAATCLECCAEIADPDSRRFGYAFTNCTNCGPRLSITRAVPYDRGNTSMAAFLMCPACRAEYENPADRRFHAQPNACPACGPRLWLRGPGGATLSGDPVGESARLISAGRIVAIKGLGGWQLAVNATDGAAVERLRKRKRRPHKPLALMAANLEAVRRHCHVSEEEAAELASPAAPIVLLRRCDEGPPLPGMVAPGMNRLGFMLAATPLHHLLMARLGGPIVLTSGNASGDPQITDDEEALSLLAGVADAFLGHDRAVVHRVDDSVVQMTSLGRQVLRHGRGMAPAPLILDTGFADLPPVLAMGGDIKNAFCLTGGGQAILSPHIGDMGSLRARRDLALRLDLLRTLSGAAPARVAVDIHPGYFASRLGREIAA